MPYEIVKSTAGGKASWRVRNKIIHKYYSKKSQSYSMALKQLRVLQMHYGKKMKLNYK